MDTDANPLSDPGALLRAARRRAGLSQRQVAERAGVKPAMISAYERNQRDPTIGTLQRLLDAVGMTLTGQLEPSGRVLDAAVLAAVNQTPLQRARQLDWTLEQVAGICAGLPHVVPGLAAALVQGAPVKVPRVEVRLANGDDVIAVAAPRVKGWAAQVWHPELRRHTKPFTDAAAAEMLRAFDPSDWMDLVTRAAVRLTLCPEEELGPGVEVPFGEQILRVTPLWELELADPEAAKVLRRTREILGTRSQAGR